MFDYIIIGAGPAGLCAAKTILQCEPAANLQILDANISIGGVWAENKLYPGLKTNNLHGGIDYADFPMHEGFGIGTEQHVTGQAMHNYVEAYAQKHDLIKRIRFSTEVREASQLLTGSGWRLVISTPDDEVIETRKLIVATGVTNEPHRPSIRGSEHFAAPNFHSCEMGQYHTRITQDPSVGTVAVLGGGKSAYDAVYLAATHGRNVEWIMRKSGKGPAWIFPAHTQLGPMKVRREKLALTRMVSFFSPSIFSDGFTWIRRFFHNNTWGRMITKRFWVQIGAATLDDCGYAKHDKTKVLIPETNPFFYGTASGVLSYETDFFQYVRSGQVRIHREDISHLSPKTIHLANGESLSVDALITATGFSAKPTVTFTPTTTHSDLGLPSTQLTKTQRAFWEDLMIKASLRIEPRFPRFLTAPFTSAFSSDKLHYNPGIDHDMRYTPWRLYRGIAPPGPTSRDQHDLAFIGMFSNIANTLRLELQCLWAYAYLNGRIDIDRHGVFDETALVTRWAEARSPFGHGRFFPDIVFDQLPYFDTLLRDLGLQTRRKATWFREIFEPYGQLDYRTVVPEWIALQRQSEDFVDLKASIA